ncbi:unnamed protein product, partial [Heterosigma akashiwo]
GEVPFVVLFRVLIGMASNEADSDALNSALRKTYTICSQSGAEHIKPIPELLGSHIGLEELGARALPVDE